MRQRSVAGGGYFSVLWNLECPLGLSQKGICVHFNEGILAQFGRSAKKKIVELCSVFLIIRLKITQIEPVTC